MNSTVKSFLPQIAFNVFMAAAVALFTLSVKAQIREELKNYITREQFQAYDVAHQKWGEEVIRGMREELKLLREELKQFREEMIRRPAPRAEIYWPPPNGIYTITNYIPREYVFITNNVLLGRPRVDLVHLEQ